MNEFDLKAKEWDKNFQNIERAKAIAEAIRKMIPLSGEINGFEYGCGTGLLSFNLADSFKNITLGDSSKGMLDIVKEKINSNNISNMKPLLIDLENEKIPVEKYDVIYTQMTLHHIIKPDFILEKFFFMLNKNGYLCIADLYKEDGSFHGKDFSGHNGFDPESFKLKIENAGFSSVKYEECYIMKKIIEDKEKMFPVFLLTAQK
jgi:2-polyprenyl-3-methyl-5-hydroxy-6-metoxy-1,4-benzoquinol methylase